MNRTLNTQIRGIAMLGLASMIGSSFGGLPAYSSSPCWFADGPGNCDNSPEPPSQAKLKKQRNGGGTRRQRAKRKPHAPKGMQSPRKAKRKNH